MEPLFYLFGVCLIPDFFFLFYIPILFLCVSFFLLSTKSLSVCRECSVLASPLHSLPSPSSFPCTAPALGRVQKFCRRVVGRETSAFRRQDERTAVPPPLHSLLLSSSHSPILSISSQSEGIKGDHLPHSSVLEGFDYRGSRVRRCVRAPVSACACVCTVLTEVTQREHGEHF